MDRGLHQEGSNKEMWKKLQLALEQPEEDISQLPQFWADTTCPSECDATYTQSWLKLYYGLFLNLLCDIVNENCVCWEPEKNRGWLVFKDRLCCGKYCSFQSWDWFCSLWNQSGTPAEISMRRSRLLKNSPLPYPQFTERQKPVHNPSKPLNSRGNTRDNHITFLLSGGMWQSYLVAGVWESLNKGSAPNAYNTGNMIYIRIPLFLY